MRDRFMGLINVAARDVRFRLDYPKALQSFKSASEESSKVASNVQTTNFSYNTSQYFLEQFLAPSDATEILKQKVRLTIFYTDPESGANRAEILEKPLSELLDQEKGNIQDAHLITLLTSILSAQISRERAEAELKLLQDRQSPLAQEYRGFITQALKLQNLAIPTPLPSATSDL